MIRSIRNYVVHMDLKDGISIRPNKNGLRACFSDLSELETLLGRDAILDLISKGATVRVLYSNEIYVEQVANGRLLHWLGGEIFRSIDATEYVRSRFA